ncbi:MAG: PhzF family phenazine biosynthesis protein [Gammaproteobacteria bacterium]
MTRQVTVFQVDAFTRELFAGNPAGVVLGAEELETATMQTLARELNHTDTAFVLPADGNDHDLRLRFFTPENETGFVGHATVAAHIALLAVGGGRPGVVRQRSSTGLYEVEVRDGAHPTVSVAYPAPQLLPPLGDRERSMLLDAMGLSSVALDARCPLSIARRTNTRLMIGLREPEALAALSPDREALKRLSAHLGADSYFAFVRDAHGPATTAARLFCPHHPRPEDPVSGNAHGMLGAYLVSHGLLPVRAGRASFTGRQGESLGRPGEVGVEIEGESGHPRRVRISGTARIVYQATLTL